MKINLIKREGRLIPYYKSDMDAIAKLKSNTVYTADFKQPRNPDHHKKLFAIANCAIDNMPEGSVWHDKTAYALIKAIQLQTGYVDQIMKLSGEVILVPQSIAFSEMDQTEFEPLYDAAVEIMSALIGVSRDELENNSVEYM